MNDPNSVEAYDAWGGTDGALAAIRAITERAEASSWDDVILNSDEYEALNRAVEANYADENAYN
jgi:hypothetical protein